MLAEGALLVPFWRSLPPEAFLAWYAAHASLLFDFFAPLEIGSAALAIASVALHRVARRAGTGLAGVAALLSIGILLAFPLYFEEVNASFASGSIAPERVAAELERWAGWHWVRTAMGVGAFVAALLALEGRARQRI